MDPIYQNFCSSGRSRGVIVFIRIVIFFLVSSPIAGMAQPIKSGLEMKTPQSLTEWQHQRKAIRDTLIKLMGDLPPTPPVTNVTTLSREDKGSYMLEKFEFDNGAGAMVPGWILIPKTGLKKYPAIYYCHWHGGNYDLGKAELFSTHHTPQVPAEVLTQMGFVVIAIDAYCFG
ncbi:MAG TPA: alpha/beta hydrolase family protein, partial [Chryseolinea sp.]|nr:alpha/beta hydrolase family protein [Chryseolinea sp.]